VDIIPIPYPPKKQYHHLQSVALSEAKSVSVIVGGIDIPMCFISACFIIPLEKPSWQYIKDACK
jgi:hypothetical protein